MCVCVLCAHVSMDVFVLTYLIPNTDVSQKIQGKVLCCVAKHQEYGLFVAFSNNIHNNYVQLQATLLIRSSSSVILTKR